MFAMGLLASVARAAAMHIPDGFLSPLVSIVFWVLAIIGVGYALQQANKELGERDIPLLGVLAAAIFAAQMLNFTVIGGTSGHLVGGALAAILLGPWAGILALTVVVAVQALIFQDGGLLVMGANIFNMAIVCGLVGYAVYQAARRLLGDRAWGLWVAGFAAAWVSLMVSALVAALQLAASGASPAGVAIPAMAGIHALIGIGEGLITVGALALVRVARPDILRRGADSRPTTGSAVALGGLLVAVILVALSPLASAFPDGLEWVAEQQGFSELARPAPYEIIPDYVVPGISGEALATMAAGVVGVLLVFAVSLLIGRLRARRSA